MKRHLANSRQKHTLNITARKVLFHMIPAVYFVDSALQTHSESLSLTDSASLTHTVTESETDRLTLSLMPQLSYHVCVTDYDLGLTALPLRMIFILGQIRITGK